VSPPSPSAGAEPLVSAVPDVIAPGLRVVFCGINPGRVSAAAAAHFANTRNDFWRLLHAAGFTPRLLRPDEQFEVLDYGIGLTNAALRTTKGSSDLRSPDFRDSAERLEHLARDLRPEWIGFVGKEAYRGAFGKRPDHGVQERQFGDTRLFVLPSTSPANAAVPWLERERWFQELAGRASGLPLRVAVRAVVLDPDDRTLLVRFDWPDKSFWAPPGGGLEEGESDEDAVGRELAEELGLDRYELGPCIWRRTHWFLGIPGWAGQTERHYLVRAPAFEPSPRADLREEGVGALAWWTSAELAESGAIFAPRRLPEFFRAVLDNGPPPEPVDAGV
jgi:TDG/mug DNA glycosylase family protein